MVPRYERLYGSKYPPAAYRKELQGMVRMLQERYGLSRRDTAGGTDGSGEATEPEQVGFAW